MPIFGYKITKEKPATIPTFNYSEIRFLVDDYKASPLLSDNAVNYNCLNSQGRGDIKFYIPMLEALMDKKRDEYLDEFLKKTPKKILINRLEKQIKLIKKLIKDANPRQTFTRYKCI